MPGIIRKNIDLSQGHCYNPVICLNGSVDVFINGSGAVRTGDSYGIVHFCYSNPPHIAGTATGSSTVFINGKGVHRSGDSLSCGDHGGLGSQDVLAG